MRAAGPWLLLALLAACGGPLERGRSALDAGRYGEAVEAAREGLISDPADGRLRLLLAEAYLGQGRYRDAAEAAVAAQVSGDLDDEELGRAHRVSAEALRDLEQHLEAALHAVDAWRLGAWEATGESGEELRALLQLGVDRALARQRPGDALALLRELRRLSREAGAGGPSDELILATGRSAAEQLLAMNAFDAALLLLGELTDEFPEADDLWLLRGGVELRLGRREAAVASFERYVGAALPAERSSRHVDVARATMAVQSWPLAIETLREALRLDPDSVDASLALIEIYLVTARVEAAEAAIDELMDRARRRGDESLATVALSIAEALSQRGYGDLALQRLGEAFATTVDQALAEALAEAYDRRQQPARAEAVMRDYVDRAAAPGAAAEAVGDWYLERGRPQAAAVLYREAAASSSRAAAAEPEAIWLKLARAYAAIDYGFELVAAVDAYVEAAGGAFEARRTAFRLLTANQRWAEAARIVEPLMEERPDDDRLRLALGEAWYYAGESEREVDLYDAWVESSRRPGEVLLRAARVFIERGSYRAALDWLERAAEVESSRPPALLELGATHQALGDDEAMWAAYETYVEASGAGLGAYQTVLERFEPRRYSALAARWLERMVAIAPDRPDLRLQRARRLMVAGDPAAEAAFVDYILAADAAGEPDALLEAARTAVWAMRIEAPPGMTARVLDAVQSARPEAAELALARARHWLDVSQRLRTSGERERALAYDAAARGAFVDYLASRPSQWPMVLRSAGEMDTAGFDDLAVDAYERALELGADEATVRRPYALALVRTGRRPERATELLTTELALDPTRVDLCLQAAGELAENGHAELALELLGRAQAAAADDEQRRRAFRAGAELLSSDGEHEALVRLANQYVEASRDPSAALLEAATALNEAGLWEAAADRARLALGRASGQAALRQVLAESAYGATGDGRAAIDTVRDGAGGSSLGAWYAVASFLEAHYELPAAFSAWGEAVERSPEPSLLVALGEAQLRVGAPPDRGTRDVERGGGVSTCEAPGCELAPALSLFQQALDQAEARGVSPLERRRLIERVAGALADTGYQAAADDWLTRGLVDPQLRADFLLAAAERALARGRDDAGRQMLETLLEEQGDEVGALADVIALELAHGFRAEPLERIRHAVLEGDPRRAAALLDRFWQHAVDGFGASTLSVWVDRLRDRGAAGVELQTRLCRALLDAGSTREAALRLAALAEAWPEAGLWSAALRAALGDDEVARDLAVRVAAAARAGEATSASGLASLLAVLTVVGDPELADDVGRRVGQAAGSAEAVVARLEWLLERHDVADAVALFRSRLATLEGASSRAAGEGDPIADAIERFGRHGYPAVALELAESDTQRAPDERFLQAIRFAFASGATDRARSLLERYVELAAGHWPALVSLGQALLDVRRDEGRALLEDALREAGDAEARQALRALLRGAAGDPEAPVSAWLDAFASRPGSLYRHLLAASETADEAGLWALAADYSRRALTLMPLRPGPFTSWLRAALAADQASEPVARFASGPRPPDSSSTLLAAVDDFSSLSPSAPSPPAISVESRAAAAELALIVEPNDFERRAVRARTLLDRGRLDDAVEAFNRLELRAPFDPLNRQVILAALVGVDDSIAVSRALATLGDPRSDVGSLELAASILDAAEHPRAGEALLAAAARAPLRDAQVEAIARWADRAGQRSVVCELAEASGHEAGRRRLADLRAICRLAEGAPAAEVVGDPETFLLGFHAVDQGLLRVADELLEQGQVELAGALLRRVAQRVDLVDGELVLGGLSRALALFEQHGLAAAAEAFVDEHFPELWRHPDVLGRP